MIIALDTEFIEHPEFLQLISIGLVAEDGREYYAQNLGCEFARANDWVQEHVYPHLQDFTWKPKGDKKPLYDLTVTQVWKAPVTIAEEIIAFVGNRPTFWGYFSAYDWVVLCQLFGSMAELPTGWPMYCHDLRAWLDENGLAQIRQPDSARHHALDDARWIMQARKLYPAQLSSPMMVPQYEGVDR